MKKIVHKIKPVRRPLYAQLLFTALAFLTMSVLSYIFMGSIVHDNLTRNAESVFTFAQVQIEAGLQERKSVLSGFSQTVRGMIIRGFDAGDLQSYINDISDYLRPDNDRLLNVNSFFGFFETLPGGPVFINGSRRVMPEGFDPSGRPWYKLAVENCGSIAETPPYLDMLNGDLVISYSRCIHDEEGVRLGVAGLNVRVSDVGKDIVDIALARGGYGMLIDQDLKVIAHANSDFVGKNLDDPALPASIFSNDILSSINFSERSLINWKGENTVAFVRKLPNGWYLGLMTPKEEFYHSMTIMAVLLTVLGTLLSSALIAVLIRIDAAKNKSDKESRHKSAFLANMSHEIRTPMNAIIGMTMIGKAAADLERKNYSFTKIEDASNHLLGVINDILDMSKIEANKFELSPHEFNFEKMLQRAVNVVNFRIDEKKQKFMIRIDRAVPNTLIGDDQRLVQVITNLLGNAAKFTPEHGSISLNARFLGEADGNCTLQISVLDSGIGISAGQQAKLFQSFQQAESSTTRKFGGTGLGLAISKSIVELMGGSIWVESETGKGSAFVFTVQLKRGARKKQSLLSSEVNWGNVRIMVVDDDPDVLACFKEITQGFGVCCDAAASGEDALSLVNRNGSYHIYFVDWKMPGMDGIQLAGELKSLAAANSVAIMMSAAEWHTIENEAKKAGIHKFLPKPLFPSAIADVINETLGYDTRQMENAQTDTEGIFAERRLLLVEDVEINREIVQALLEPTHVEIDCAENGAEAVRIFDAAPEKYDMILMDLQMPEMDGYEATRCIRALEAKRKDPRGIPIIAMTANVFREDIERCLEAGMDGHIGKPLDFDETLGILRTYLSCDDESKE